jgi:hypothetical protein
MWVKTAESSFRHSNPHGPTVAHLDGYRRAKLHRIDRVEAGQRLCFGMQSCVDCYPRFPFAVCIGVDGQQDFLTVKQTRPWHMARIRSPICAADRSCPAHPIRKSPADTAIPDAGQMPGAKSRALQKAESAAEHAFAQVTIVIACPVVRCSAP